MASIRRRPNGKWQARVSMGVNENGKTIVRYLTKDTLKECKQAVFELEQQKVMT